MKEQLISFKTAKLAKDKGFFIKCKNYYNTENPLGADGLFPPVFEHSWSLDKYVGEEFTEKHTEDRIETGFLKYQINNFVEAPTQSLLQKWLRDVHDSYIMVDLEPINIIKWHYVIKYKNKTYFNVTGEIHKTKSYEEALEEGLLLALELIKKIK